MPVPAGISQMGISAHLCASLPRVINNPHAQTAGRTQLNRTFRVYLELTMQAKHDAVIRGHCQSIGVVGRKEDGTQVRHGAGATGASVLAGFYAQKAAVAADVVSELMTKKWQTPVPPGQQTFTPGTRVDAGVQNQVQSDRHQYEISYWYDNQDIYVLFHVYPSR